MVGFLGDNMEKIVKQEFDISSEDKKQVRLNAKIYSQDINSGVFELSFSDKGVDITLDDTYEVTVLLLFRSSERKVFVDTKIEKGIATFTFDNRLITDWDIVDSYVYLKKGDQTVDVNSFSFKVDVSKIDQVVSDIKIYYIEDLEDVKAEYIKEIDGIKKGYQELLDAYIDKLPSEVLDEDAKAEIIQARGGQSSLDSRLDVLDAKDTDLQNQVNTNKSNISGLDSRLNTIVASAQTKANSSDMTSLQSAMNSLQSKVEAFGITPENLVTIKSLLDAIANNATDSEVAELINSVNVLTSNISLMSNGDYSPKANKTDLESLQSAVNNQSATISAKANQIDLDNLQTDVQTKVNAIYTNALSDHAEILTARGGQSSLDVRLDGLDTKYTDLENETTTQLAQKANLSEVRKNTMLQPITMAELSTEVKSGMTGGSVAVVGSNSTGKENIKTKAVTQGKTDFVKHGKNYFNKVKIVNGQYRSYTNGSLVTDALQFYSDYIEVDGGLTYTVNKPYTHICFYDDNYVFISGYLVNNTEASKTFTTPTNCRKLIVSTRISELNKLQLEEGNTVTSFEEYSIFIDDLKIQLDKVIGKVTEDKIEDRVITPLKTTFLTTGKNLLNKEKTTDNYRIMYNSGVKVADNNYAYTEHIAVVSGQTYVFNITFSHVCFYDKDYNYLSGLVFNDTVRSFTVPDNAIRVVISFSKNLKSRAQLEIGAVSTSYESYYLRFVYDSAPIDMRLIEPYPTFTKPYVYDKKLYTNSSGKPRTAVYTGVDAQVVPKGMRSKIRFLPGSQQGTVALISNQNGLTTVKNITDKSLHIVFTQTNANIGIFDGNGLENLKTVNYKERCKVDGETEYEIGWSVEGNTISVTTPEGEVTTVTDDRIPLVMGKYCTFEHYWDGAMAARPIFSYFEVTDNTDTPIITDDFDRPDGEIATAPTGQSYTTFHI